MAEQNILNGNQEKLEQILSDIKEHNAKKDRLEKLNASVKDITKELETAKKEKQNETVFGHAWNGSIPHGICSPDHYLYRIRTHQSERLFTSE